jgi:hypothetical protein
MLFKEIFHMQLYIYAYKHIIIHVNIYTFVQTNIYALKHISMYVNR